MPYSPGRPESFQAVRLSAGGENRDRSMPWGTTAVVLGTNDAAKGVVEITASILEINQRGKAPCRCCAADVKTNLMGKRSTSRAKIAAIISGSRRTCQMRNALPAGGLRDNLMASRSVMPSMPLDMRVPQKPRRHWCACKGTSALMVADTPV